MKNEENRFLGQIYHHRARETEPHSRPGPESVSVNVAVMGDRKKEKKNHHVCKNERVCVCVRVCMYVVMHFR